MNRVFGGGGLSSRLMARIRIEKGLAYSVYSGFSAHRHPGTFQVVLQTGNSTAAEAVAVVREEMKRIQHEPVSAQELAMAKQYLVGSFPLLLDTQSKLASFLGQVVYYDLSLDYPARFPALIGSVGRQDVQRTARRYLKPDRMILSVVGDLEKIGDLSK